MREAFEHQPFAPRELDRLRVDLQLMSVQIDRQAAQPHDAARRQIGATDQRAAARRQLRLLERLHQKIIGAQIEGADLVGQRIARRQHQHRHRPAVAAQRAEQAQAIRARQADIDHRQIEVLGVERRAAALGRGRMIDREAGQRQPAHDRVGDQLIVFDQQYAHAPLGAMRPGFN